MVFEHIHRLHLVDIGLTKVRHWKSRCFHAPLASAPEEADLPMGAGAGECPGRASAGRGGQCGYRKEPGVLPFDWIAEACGAGGCYPFA